VLAAETVAVLAAAKTKPILDPVPRIAIDQSRPRDGRATGIEARSPSERCVVFLNEVRERTTSMVR
jgi:hypothetical protein